MMFERVLYTVLKDALEQFVQNKPVIDSFLAEQALEDEIERESVRDIILKFAQQKKPIIHSYARDDTKFPVWAIVLSGESEGMRCLGDESDDDDEYGEPIKSSIWNATFQILVYSEHPDVTLYLYSILKGLILERRVELIRRGNLLDTPSINGGEVSPDQVYMPAFLFVRALTITAQGEERGVSSLPQDSTGTGQALPVTQVTGLHVFDPDMPPDGLRHRVTTYER
jgi:hypothetical protein